MTTPTNGERQFQKLLNSEVVLCTKLIIQNARIDELLRVVIYNDGWNDNRVLEELRRKPGRDKLKVTHVVDFRRDNFGLLEAEYSTRRPATTPCTNGDLVLRVANLERQFAELQRLVRQ